MTSSELTGGAGFTFEDAVAAYYLAAIVGGTAAAGTDARVVHRVAQQQADFGEPLDDVIVDAVSGADATTMRLSLQVKRSLTISDADTNHDFRDAIQRCWQTLQKPGFREHVDRVGAALGSVAEGTSRALTTVCEWARASDTPVAFMQRFVAGSNASATHREVADAVRRVARDAPLTDAELHRLLAHLVLIRFDFLHIGSVNEADTISGLQRALSGSHAGRASDLWNLIRQAARDGNGRSAVHTRVSLIRALPGWRFAGAPALVADIEVVRESTRHWLGQQTDDIAGTHLPRQALRDELAAQTTRHRLTLIKGLPGTGKTVLVRDLAQSLAAEGTTILLTANRLSGRSWPEHARAMGLSGTSVEPLLTEVAATGHSTLLVDGLDRVAPEQRAILTDIFGQLLSNPALADWRVVATARDAGIEPLRNWVPAALLTGSGVGYVTVENLNDEEAASLGGALPALRPLLTGANERVRALARRPFFAAVLARGLTCADYPSSFAPQSEVDLVNAWWARGGYDADAPQALSRQRALIEVAQRSAPDLGRNVRIRDLSPGTQNVLPALEEDGVVQQVRVGHTAQFSHDIFFEWSFLHLLLDQGEQWIPELSAAGEPPALGRVVELLSQATYEQPQQWLLEVESVGQAQVRPQWIRAWLIAPVFSAHFSEHADTYASALDANDHRLLRKLLVWMQAEKTTPNPLVLSGQLGREGMSAAERIRLADAMGWPSDIAAWGRLIVWMAARIDSIPDRCLPELVTLFETWQMAVADIANPVSEQIVGLCSKWLCAIDDEEAEDRSFRSSTEARNRSRAPDNLQAELRALLLRAARAYHDVVGAYLSRAAALPRWPDKAYRATMDFAPLLAQTHPQHLAQLARNWFMEELPDESVARWNAEYEEERRHREEIEAIPLEERSPARKAYLESPTFHRNSFSHHDWRNLAIGADHYGYFPPSPLREPFHSLLEHDTPTGLALIRDVSNHATTAWLQLHGQDEDERRGTPLPLVLNFPWGVQEFWGDDHHYEWFRGHGGPQVIESALMALERWAIAQQEAQRPLPDLLRELLDGHISLAVLGIAVHLALRANEASAVTLPLLASQRLWRLDQHRAVKEGQFLSAGLLGFKRGTADAPHVEAVTASGQARSRKRHLRELAMPFALSSNAALRDACRAALDAFPSELGFAYQEEADDPANVAALRQTAELWAEFGHTENYSVQEVPGRDDVVQISMTSARHESPDVRQAQQRYQQVSREAELWLWVDKCFSAGEWAAGFTPAEAVERAQELISIQQAGGQGTLMPGSGFSEGAIAGTAAAIICFSDAAGHWPWADALIERLRLAAEPTPEEVFSASVIPWHAKIFVAHALASRIRTGRDELGDREALYWLVAHGQENVSLTALSGVLSCWDRDARFAWCGVNLAFRLTQLPQRREVYRLTPEERRQAEQERRESAVTATLAEYRAQGPLPAWVRPRPYWVPASPDARRHRGHDEVEGWERSNDSWYSSYAAKVLQQLPVAKIMAHDQARARFLDALEALLAWTLQAVNPKPRNARRGGRDRSDANMIEWQGELGRSIALAAPLASNAELRDRLLRPILEEPDEIAMKELEPFVDRLVRAEVLDAPVLQADILDHLQVVMERVLQHRDLRRSPYNEDRMNGFDLPELIKSLLFVSVEHAPRAARFANGRWEDIGRVLHLVDRMVRAAGWNSYVARQFVTLCERAGAAYPAETWADQVLSLVVDGYLPDGWKSTSVPAALAGLVQAHADRQHPLPPDLARKLLRVLDALVDLGDRRSAALQQSESFRGVRLEAP